MAPAILSLLGLAGIIAARVFGGVPLASVFLIAAIAGLAGANYLISVRKAGTRLGRVIVWVTTIASVSIWATGTIWLRL